MRIAVIMSTYNGEKYIHEQINSILNQKSVKVDLFVRDDGSSDHTVSILKEYERKYNNVYINLGKNVGFRRSFIQELLSHKGYDYYAFSDQDDFWEEEKLKRACDVLKKKCRDNFFALYYSNLNIADEQLNIYKKTELDKRRKSLESVIMRRSIAGCTMVLNSNLWKKISEKKITDEMLRRGHDSFIISLCYSLGGRVVCDPQSHIRYRQHNDNTSGGMRGPKQRIKKEWDALWKKKGQESEIAASILKSWGDELTKESKKTLSIISKINDSKLYRIKVFLSPRFTTGNLRLTILGKIKVMLGLL